MKKCLITGASGSIGIKLINELLVLNEYEIIAVDLKSKRSIKELGQFKNKIRIVYTDINDKSMIDSLIKDSDIIFHLAGILPPNSELHYNLMNIVDYGGTKSIVDSINELNPNCYLIYPSTTCIYGNQDKVTLNSDINIYNDGYYSQNKYKIENYIEKELKNYTIYRIPLIIDENSFDNFMYNLPLNKKIEVITNELVAIALAKSLKHKRKLNKKKYILSGGKKFQTTTNELISNVLKVYGISSRYLLMKYFIPQNFYTHIYEDSNELNEILDFQKGSISDVYNNFLKLKKFKRCLNRLFAYITINKLSK